MAEHNSRIEFLMDATFKGKTVFTILVFLVTTVGSIVWYLYTTGSFSPDIGLSKELATISYKYEKLSKDNEVALNEILSLKKYNKQLSTDIYNYKSGMELEKIKSEERIRIKQLELENSRILEISKAKYSMSITESEAQKYIKKQELAVRKVQSETLRKQSDNEKEIRIMEECMKFRDSSDHFFNHDLKNCIEAATTNK